MIESISIISGKGGSGKTTLAISLSQLLASCSYKVLLVDCDLSTHGATYFFEEMLIQKNKYYTVSNILYDNNVQQHSLEILMVSPKIGFIPSRVDFSSKQKPIGAINKNKLVSFFNEMEKDDFDVVIFDCQAGYSIETEVITTNSKKNLAVIEADAISASALRVLYAQLAGQLDAGKTYQIFNKITREEQETYSKLTHETLFTNLNPIIFDWNVRKAFVTNELPDIGLSNPNLTTSIYDLAMALFPQFREKLRNFILGIKQKKSNSMIIEIERLKNDRKKKVLKYVFEFILPIFTMLFTIIAFSSSFFMLEKYTIILIFSLVLVIGMFFSLLVILFNKTRDNYSRNKIIEIRKERELLEEEIHQINEKLNN